MGQNGTFWSKLVNICQNSSKFARFSENTIKQLHSYTSIDSIYSIDCSDSSDSRDSCNSSDGMHITEVHQHKGVGKCFAI